MLQFKQETPAKMRLKPWPLSNSRNAVMRRLTLKLRLPLDADAVTTKKYLPSAFL